MKNQISKVQNASNEAYKLIIEFISNNEDVSILDYLYPEHDGEYIEDRCAELISLRYSCFSLVNACYSIMEKLERVIYHRTNSNNKNHNQ